MVENAYVGSLRKECGADSPIAGFEVTIAPLVCTAEQEDLYKKY